MTCPKCGFALPGAPERDPIDPVPAEGTCPKCGIIFSKLRRERSPEPRFSKPEGDHLSEAAVPPSPSRARAPQRSRPPRPARDAALSQFRERERSPRGFSVLNVLLLSIAASTAGLLYWSGTRGESGTASGEVPFPSATADSSGDGAAPTAGQSTGSPSSGGATLVLPGFTASGVAPVATPDENAPASIPRLPDLSESTVTPALLERAKALAAEHPDEAWLGQYVLATHLLLAGRKVAERDFGDALRYVEGAERWGAPTGDVASVKAVIYGEQQEWELAARWARTALGYGSQANPAEMHHVIGKALYFREEMDKAIAAFEKALSIRDDPRIRASLERALREDRASGGFDQKRLSHFIVSYEGGTMEDTGRLVMDQMERSYASLVSQLGYEPAEPVVVILYSRRSYREMGGPHWSAGFFDGKIRVPVRGLDRLDQHLRNTLHHELAHAFVHGKAGGAAPRWLHEGVAEYVEGTRTTAFGEQLAELLNSGRSFEACISTASCDVRVFYPAAASMVDYMIQNRGIGGLRDVLSALGEGLSIDEALRRVWGRDELGMIQEWQHFIRRRYS